MRCRCVAWPRLTPSQQQGSCFFSLMGFSFLQGTVLDRIDFNVEQSCVKTEDGLKQLQKVNVCTSSYKCKETFQLFPDWAAGVSKTETSAGLCNESAAGWWSRAHVLAFTNQFWMNMWLFCINFKTDFCPFLCRRSSIRRKTERCWSFWSSLS